MSEEGKVVFLEDVQASKETVNGEAVAGTEKERAVSSEKLKATAAANIPSTNGTLKRQRTLMEMMSGGSKTSDAAGGAQRSGKKQKTNSSPPADEKQEARSSKAITNGLQPLNSIPFSLSSFKESLSDEARELLQLECETMGLSWWVFF